MGNQVFFLERLLKMNYRQGIVRWPGGLRNNPFLPRPDRLSNARGHYPANIGYSEFGGKHGQLAVHFPVCAYLL